MQSAIVIVGPENRGPEGREPESREEDSRGDAGEASLPATTSDQEGFPLSCVEVLGLSVVARFIEEFHRAGISTVSVLGNISGASFDFDSAARVQPCSKEEVWRKAAEQLWSDKQNSAEAILIVRAGAYLDLDLKDFFQFHREHGQAVTRAFDREGPLDVWIVDPAGIAEGTDILALLYTPDPIQYLVRGYVNHLEHPRDLRRLVVDSLTSRCGLRPQGTEIRPGIWMDDSAQVHRDARIVAPAFIGRGARVGEQCLITRSSNIESNCQVDYGTVVEDSSILSNSYVGIGLDLSHSIVDGNNLLNLERNVTLEIADPCVIRPNRVSRSDKNFKLPVPFGLGGVHFSQVEEGSR